eukprot:gene11001-12819_t
MDWIDFKDCSTKLAYSPENHLLIVKPDTYLIKDNHEVLSRLIRLMPNIRADTFLAVHYEHLFKLGVIERTMGGRTKHNPGLSGITSVFQTETPFLLNRFPDVQLELVDKMVLPYAANEVLTAILEMKQKASTVGSQDESSVNFATKSPRVDTKNIDLLR